MSALKSLRAVAVVFALFGIVPLVVTNDPNALASSSSYAGVLPVAVALGLAARARIALSFAKLSVALQVVLLFALMVASVTKLTGPVSVGIPGTSAFTQAPAVVVPVMVGLLLATWWQGRELHRSDVVSLFAQRAAG